MTSVFLAYASGNEFHETIIREAAAAASTPARKVTAWSQKDTSGQPIARSVEVWIEESDAFVGDISTVNMNVTYEIGYAIGLNRPVRLIRSSHTEFASVREVGLLDTLGHDTYDFQKTLRTILEKPDITPTWIAPQKNRDQPVFVLQPSTPTDWSRQAISAIKKVARLKYRGFNPAEISRLTASEAFEHAAISFGVVVFWIDSTNLEAKKNNQRASFIYGVARAAEIPAILIAHESSQLPLDIHESAARWGRLDNIDELIANFRDKVADKIFQY